MLGLAAAWTPQAIAAEGTVDAAVPPVPNASELATAILEEASAAPVAVALPEVAAESLPAAPAQPAAAEPVQAGADAAPPSEPVSEPEPAPAPEPLPDAPPLPEPPVQQQEPTNVNVSVRIDSPGDDGDVTQVNVAVDAAPPQYQPDPPQYQPVVAPAGEPEPAPAPVERTPRTSTPAPAESWDWTWNWSCGDAPVGDIAIPFGIEDRDWNWNWTWICGGSDGDVADVPQESQESIERYQPTPIQYRPVNINIAIRINSPGDNGPVTQANVAVGLTLPVPVFSPLQPPVEAPAASEATPAATVEEPALPSAPTLAFDAGVPAEMHVDCCPPAAPNADTRPDGPLVSVVLAANRARFTRDTADATGDIAVTARLELRARRAAVRADAPAARPEARPARQAPARRDARLGRETVVVQGGLGFAPLAGPDRLLPYVALLVAAFLFAFATASWVAAESRPTPGVHADDPPDRPG